MNTIPRALALLLTVMLFGVFAGDANAQKFVDWDETTDISPVDTLLVNGVVDVGSSSIGVTFTAHGSDGHLLFQEISDTAVNFRDASIFSPAPDRVSVVRPKLGYSDLVEIVFSSPVRNPSLYGNALGANTLTFSDPFTVVGTDGVATIDLVARTIKGINANDVPAHLRPNAGGSQEADYQIQFTGVFTSLSFTSDRGAGKNDINSFAISVVPEPSSATILALAGTCAFLRRKRRRS